MSRRLPSLLDRLGRLGAAFDGAVSAAIAVENGRKPTPRALARLGLPADAFDDVRLG